jgi:hypothetical protein
MSRKRKRPEAGITDVAALVDSFSKEGYAVMSLDAVRNAAFAKALHYSVVHERQHTWLEIGTGADALLARFILRAGTAGMKPGASISTSAECDSTKPVITTVRVCAIEGGQAACEGAARRLRPFQAVAAGRGTAAVSEDALEFGEDAGDACAPYLRRSAWALVSGLSSAAATECSVGRVAAAWGLPGDRFPALVHELLGFFASAEWAIQSVRALICIKYNVEFAAGAS